MGQNITAAGLCGDPEDRGQRRLRAISMPGVAGSSWQATPGSPGAAAAALFAAESARKAKDLLWPVSWSSILLV